MPLSTGLRDKPLTFNCPHCGRATVKNGGWFQTIGRFTCRGCERTVRLTYDDKLALFQKHAHLIDSGLTSRRKGLARSTARGN